MRRVPDSLDQQVVAEIDQRLDVIVATSPASVVLAVGSGSRAWGFPSPDSDYDCRFVFVRSAGDYLSPWPVRDVIELAPDGLLDINGWDLRKAVQLLVAGNAVILEWAQSPIVYRAEPEFVGRFVVLAERVADRAAIARHYLHVGQKQWDRFITPDGQMPLKKLFYSLRPAAALRWLRQHPESAVPPMALEQLLAQSGPPPRVAAAVGDLVSQKAVTREMATDTVPEVVRTFVLNELREEPWMVQMPDAAAKEGARDEAARFFRAAVRNYGGQSLS